MQFFRRCAPTDFKAHANKRALPLMGLSLKTFPDALKTFADALINCPETWWGFADALNGFADALIEFAAALFGFGGGLWRFPPAQIFFIRGLSNFTATPMN